jgi:hypothetical protein
MFIHSSFTTESRKGLLQWRVEKTGLLEVARPAPAFRENGMGWGEDFSPTLVKLIGLAEVLGGIGLVVPVITGIANPGLGSPVSAPSPS